jgi:hypothetical protein
MKSLFHIVLLLFLFHAEVEANCFQDLGRGFKKSLQKFFPKVWPSRFSRNKSKEDFQIFYRMPHDTQLTSRASGNELAELLVEAFRKKEMDSSEFPFIKAFAQNPHFVESFIKKADAADIDNFLTHYSREISYGKGAGSPTTTVTEITKVEELLTKRLVSLYKEGKIDGRRAAVLIKRNVANIGLRKTLASEFPDEFRSIYDETYESVDMIRGYRGEHLDQPYKNGKVKYLDDVERERVKTTVDENGLLRNADGEFVNTTEPAIFVVDEKGDILLSSNQELGKFHHSSLNAGGDVLFAGEIVVKNGVIQTISDESGHYRPNPRLMIQLKRILASKGVDTKYIEYELLTR